MQEAKKKVVQAIEKKEAELLQLKEKEKIINRKIAEREKKASEQRIRKWGNIIDGLLKKQYGADYYEMLSIEEIYKSLEIFVSSFPLRTMAKEGDK